MYETRVFPIKGLDLKKICNDIAKKDETFKFKLLEHELLIYSKDRETAFRRGGWFRHIIKKEFGKEVWYDVRYARE